MKSRSLASPRKRGDSAAPSRTCSPLDLSPAEPDAAEPPPPYGGGTISRIHPFTVRRSPGPLSQGQFGGSTCAGVRSLEADRAWGVRGLFMRPTQAIEKVGGAPAASVTTPAAPTPVVKPARPPCLVIIAIAVGAALQSTAGPQAGSSLKGQVSQLHQ